MYAEILARPLEGDLRGFHVGLRHLVGVFRGVELDFGEHFAVEQTLVALVFHARLLALRAGAIEPRLRLRHGLLLQRRVDARDQLALLHVIVEVGEDRGDLTGHLRAHLHGGHGAQHCR